MNEKFCGITRPRGEYFHGFIQALPNICSCNVEVFTTTVLIWDTETREQILCKLHRKVNAKILNCREAEQLTTYKAWMS